MMNTSLLPATVNIDNWLYKQSSIKVKISAAGFLKAKI